MATGGLEAGAVLPDVERIKLLITGNGSLQVRLGYQMISLANLYKKLCYRSRASGAISLSRNLVNCYTTV